MNKQLHIYYNGMVQGVGFRFMVESIAAKLGVCGWVKNLGDGRVEVIAQAGEGALKEFLAQISQHFSRYIHDTYIQWQEPSEKFEVFSIRH
jgi:acylphosphatase